MPNSSRSQRQLESLRRMRDWHLKEALKAKMEGRKEQADFHYRYYDLLGAAVEEEPREC
ncbi:MULTISPECIES: hypothetical protein [unclassified Pseudomonas]|uniref:hypothetical protein n=1 Tax=unclassified Pseudomonas TaxID=196821 RepID=UPI001313FA1C|nr:MULTISPECIES: hypothetical protein [unclassified Pseudomonas]